MGFEESGRLFSEAERRMRKGDVIDAFDLYCDALIDRLSVENTCVDFLCFYRSQLVKYLKEKKSLDVLCVAKIYQSTALIIRI